MPEPTSLASEHTISIDAPANVVFDILADTAIWPSIFRAVIYVERTEVSQTADQLRVWALRDGEQVTAFTSHRELDRDAGQISFRDEPAEEPLTASSGRWSIADGPDGSSTVRLEHRFTPAAGADPQRVRAAQEAVQGALLTELADAAGRYKELPELIVAFEDPLYIAGDVEQVYELLYRADEWPSRFPHVKRIDMTETTPNIQFFDMDTVTPDGRAHTTRSVRICFPNRKIVYKQIGLPPLLTAHLGHWLFEENPEGLIASARHEATIKPAALSILAPEATVQDARRYLRKVLSANSMSNLRIAKDLVERPSGA